MRLLSVFCLLSLSAYAADSATPSEADMPIVVKTGTLVTSEGSSVEVSGGLYMTESTAIRVANHITTCDEDLAKLKSVPQVDNSNTIIFLVTTALVLGVVGTGIGYGVGKMSH